MLVRMTDEDFQGWRAAYKVHGWNEADDREDLCQAVSAHAISAFCGGSIPFEELLTPRLREDEPETTPEQQAQAAHIRLKQAKASAKAKQLAEQGFTHEEIMTAIAPLMR